MYVRHDRLRTSSALFLAFLLTPLSLSHSFLTTTTTTLSSTPPVSALRLLLHPPSSSTPDIRLPPSDLRALL